MLITRNELRTVRNMLALNSEGQRVFKEAMEDRTRRPRSDEVTVFLSHKHDDVEPLRDAIALLESLGVSVYVDWLDEQMPTHTSGATATRIKQKIRDNRKFILLATQPAIDSKWCNWELGVADPLKYHQHMAILPVAENDRTWRGNEYLQVYPSIQVDGAFPRPSYYVEFQGQKYPLGSWLRS